MRSAFGAGQTAPVPAWPFVTRAKTVAEPPPDRPTTVPSMRVEPGNCVRLMQYTPVPG